jgi:hypothetical protein
MTELKQLKGIFHSLAKSLEILYILEGIKPVARQGFYDSELPAVKQFCRQHNLHLELSPYKVILVDANYPGQYSNKGVKVKADDPRRGMYFAYISKDETKAIQASCLELKNRHKELGLALGYPECCSNFFQRYEPHCSKLDSNYTGPCLTNSKGRIFPFQNNILKQSQDITLLNHFPCSLACQPSVRLANQHLEAIKKHDRNLAVELAKQLKGEFKIGSRFIRFI